MSSGHDAHDLEVDVILLNARGKWLLLIRTRDGFAGVLLDRGEADAMLAGRPQFGARTVMEVGAVGAIGGRERDGLTGDALAFGRVI